MAWLKSVVMLPLLFAITQLTVGQPARVEASIRPSMTANVVRQYSNTHASQGVAVDANFIYAVSNSTIGKFNKSTGAEVGQWAGDPARYPHINSCAVLETELVCASSNYPATPMRSTVEVFDPQTMTLLRSIPLTDTPGSVTWVDRRDGHWWVGCANYDGAGGQAGRDHTFTTVVEYDARWKTVARWRFPKSVLDRFAPYSTSGGAFGDDGLIYLTGHDRPELYAMRAPKGGGELVHVATLAIAVDGQAIAWDRSQTRILYSISRATGAVVAMQVPTVAAASKAHSP